MPPEEYMKLVGLFFASVTIYYLLKCLKPELTKVDGSHLERVKEL